ncbi:MAG: DUF2892 domain-containing protein [Halieaceae bacterium]|jgi:hypothetical protein|nr:DUF2892 domain-containing protein [Halieaceae bacterium]
MRKNLGTIERGIRLLLALALLSVLILRPSWGWIEAATAVAATFLVLNALSGRCYLWRWLGINSRGNAGDAGCAINPPHEDATKD